MGRWDLRRSSRRTAVVAIAIAVGAGTSGAGPQTPTADALVDQSCQLALVKVDPSVVNVAFPDEAAAYYGAAYASVPGLRLRISGRFPYARYMSFHVYDNATRPLDALSDVEMDPAFGSTNPYFVGADRFTRRRDYTAFVDFGPIPQQRARNTLYAGGGQAGLPNANGLFIYRIYLHDHGLDETAGVGLPTVTLETTAGATPPPSLCRDVTRPAIPDVNDDVAQADGPPGPEPGDWPGRNPPHWRKTKNLVNSYGAILLNNPYGDPAYQAFIQSGADSVGGSGGFYGNLHNNYAAALINRGYGQVLAFRMRAPSFPDTRGGLARFPESQLRYFSICQNEVVSQRYVSCLADDEILRNPDGFMTFIISTPEDRPANATAECGVNWIPWGPVRDGVVIYRHMLPWPTFAQAIQRIPAQGQELETMGDYHPASRYFAERGNFEALGCGGAAHPPGLLYREGVPAPDAGATP